MTPHCHVFPSVPGCHYPYLVIHFDGRGKWVATSYCDGKDQATKQSAVSNRRYRNQRRARKASITRLDGPPRPQQGIDGATPENKETK